MKLRPLYTSGELKIGEIDQISSREQVFNRYCQALRWAVAAYNYYVGTEIQSIQCWSLRRAYAAFAIVTLNLKHHADGMDLYIKRFEEVIAIWEGEDWFYDV